MSRKLSTVLIIGSSGTIGTHISKALAKSRASFDRVAIFTSPSTVENKKEFIADLQNNDVNIITGDINNDSDVKGVFEGNRYIPLMRGVA